MATLVSVIIPCYNVASYIEECIVSVISQTYRPLEIICIDNNSCDETAQALVGLKEKYPDLIIDQERKPGANAARNKGLSLAKGEWLQYLDADDLLKPGKIEHQMLLVTKAEKNLAFVAGSYLRRNTNGKEQNCIVFDSVQELAVFTNQAGITSSNLWSCGHLKKIEGWNEEINSSQEAELMMRLTLQGSKFITDSLPLTVVRDRESGQISSKDPGKNLKVYVEVRLNYLSKLRAIQPEFYVRNKGRFQDFLMVTILSLTKYDLEVANSHYQIIRQSRWQSHHLYGFSRLKTLLLQFLGLRLYSFLINKN